MLVFGCSRCEILFWKIPLFGNFVVVFLTHGVSCAEVESDWAGISWLEEAPGLFCQTPNTETTKNIPRNIIKQKQCFIFLWHLHQKSNFGCPKKTTFHVGNSKFPTFFCVLSWWPSQHLLLGSSLEMAHHLGWTASEHGSVRWTGSSS